MYSNSILSSSLLDIIFEKRNKGYGAYPLRKNYNKRLTTALAIALLIVTAFVFYQLLAKKNIPIPIKIITASIDPMLWPMKNFEKKNVLKKPVHAHAGFPKSLDSKPVIVKTNEAFHSKLLINNMQTFRDVRERSSFEETNADHLGGRKEIVLPQKQLTPEGEIKTVISPEVPPQFHGGVKELIKFLRQNLNIPDELQAGQEISVKAKFIVSYSGELLNIELIESGGDAFDNEVIRVLKKMPKWDPGKSNGQSVSAYFLLPVKFKDSN